MNKFQEEEQKFINLLGTASEKIQPIICELAPPNVFFV